MTNIPHSEVNSTPSLANPSFEKNERRIGLISVKLAEPYTGQFSWLSQPLAERELNAAWLKLSPQEPPMNPRIIGKPGVGKTSLSIVVARSLDLPVYIMQGTSDTRPEDLLITPVLTENKSISYIASPLVTAMLVGGVCILDEGNRMSEKSWASLAPLLDERRYVDSVLAGVRIPAHENFRFVTTMNDDASVFDLPEYIQSRLNPQIFLDFQDPQTEAKIIKMSVPYVEDEILEKLVNFLFLSHNRDESYSVRDAIQVCKYAQRLKKTHELSSAEALRMSIVSVIGEDALKYIPQEQSTIKDKSHLRPLF